MKQTDPQLKLRLPPALKEAIEASAESAGRSMSAEIVLRLQRTFDEDAHRADPIAVMRAVPTGRALEEVIMRAVHHAIRNNLPLRDADGVEHMAPDFVTPVPGQGGRETLPPQAGTPSPTSQPVKDMASAPLPPTGKRARVPLIADEPEPAPRTRLKPMRRTRRTG